MSFREKSAWVTLITLIVLSLAFALHLPRPWTLRPEPSGFMFHVLLIAIGTFIAIEVIAHIAIAVWSPRDANSPKDEREILIELKSTRVAAFVYAFLSLGSVSFGLHIASANAIGIAYLILISFVAAEIINYAMRVFYYRRGS